MCSGFCLTWRTCPWGSGKEGSGPSDVTGSVGTKGESAWGNRAESEGGKLCIKPIRTRTLKNCESLHALYATWAPNLTLSYWAWGPPGMISVDKHTHPLKKMKRGWVKGTLSRNRNLFLKTYNFRYVCWVAFSISAYPCLHYSDFIFAYWVLSSVHMRLA